MGAVYQLWCCVLSLDVRTVAIVVACVLSTSDKISAYIAVETLEQSHYYRALDECFSENVLEAVTLCYHRT